MVGDHTLLSQFFFGFVPDLYRLSLTKFLDRSARFRRTAHVCSRVISVLSAQNIFELAVAKPAPRHTQISSPPSIRPIHRVNSPNKYIRKFAGLK